MFDKVQSVLRVFGMILPAPVRAVILELAAEVDRLRKEVNDIRSTKGAE